MFSIDAKKLVKLQKTILFKWNNCSLDIKTNKKT